MNTSNQPSANSAAGRNCIRNVTRNTVLFTLLAMLVLPLVASAKIRVGASLTDLASIASSVGGDQVEVFSIARATSDPHRVEVLPSYMVQVARANLYLKSGLGLDQWADGIIDGSRNSKLAVLDCSKDIKPLEKPAQVNASMGDVHPFGNPHYWLDPRNGAIVARGISEQLSRIDPAHADAYAARAAAFEKQVAEAYERDQKIVAGMPVKAIFTYHSSWVYFADAFGFTVAATAEPVPGIPPTAKHLASLVGIAKQRKIPLLLQEPYFSDDAGKFLARETGTRIVKAAPSCQSVTAGSYLAHFETVLYQIAGTPPASGVR